jgi:hypothetical protein
MVRRPEAGWCDLTVVRFACKTQGCDQEVTYEPQPTQGLAYPGQRPGGDTLTVYLTCPEQHTHPYQVEREA